MKDYKIKTSFDRPDRLKAQAKKLVCIYFFYFYLIFLENWLYNDAIHDFSVWLQTGSNQADINRFRSHNGKK